MKREIFQYSFRSLGLRLTLLITLALTPVIGLLFYNIRLSRTTLLDQIQSTHTSMLHNYSLQIEAQMTNVSSYLINELFYGNDMQIVMKSENSAKVAYGIQNIQYSLEQQLNVSDYMDGLFLYVYEADGYRSMISSTNYRHSSLNQMQLKTLISSLEFSGSSIPSWEILDIDGEDYMVFIIYSPDEMSYAGAYTKVANLLDILIPDTKQRNDFLLVNESLLPDLTLTLPGDYTLAYSKLHESLLLGEKLSKSTVNQNLPVLSRYRSFEVTVIIILIVFFLTEIYRFIIYPIYRLAGTMHNIEKGNLDERAVYDTSSTEMEILSSTFNRMLDNIQHLTVDVIQEQLRVQRAQLRNLQLQIKPHFLINSLNMIYNLIETKQPDTAQKLIKHSVEYLRYMTKADENLVPLYEEVEHVKAYLEIQRLRYNNMFHYDIQVDPKVEDMLIPPLIIQNLAENSIKYALNTTLSQSKDSLNLSVRIHSFEKEYYPYATIEVRDNGTGYPEEMLQDLNDGKHIYKKDGTHIGLRNMTQRLRFTFGDKVQWSFSNDQGAFTTITLPVTFHEDDE